MADQILIVTELYVYPIKSLGGIALDRAVLTDRGFEHDRRWMLVDAAGRFMTQREHPTMALLQVQFTHTGLLVHHKDHPTETLSIPFNPSATQPYPGAMSTTMVQIWDDVCEAQYVSREADAWFSAALSFPCRLVYMPDDSRRMVDARYATQNEITSLSDAFPVLIIGQSSLDDLNRRMREPLPMDRFRPNIVFSGGDPYEEDTMAHFRIGETDFYAVKPCARCAITTIRQDNGVAGKEPLRTLAGYRNKNQKVYFGQNVLYSGNGPVEPGNRIEVVKRREAIDFGNSVNFTV